MTSPQTACVRSPAEAPINRPAHLGDAAFLVTEGAPLTLSGDVDVDRERAAIVGARRFDELERHDSARFGRWSHDDVGSA